MPSYTNKDWLILSQDIGNEFKSLSDAITLYRDEVLMKNIDKGIDVWIKEQLSQGRKYSDTVQRIILSRKDEILQKLNESSAQIAKIIKTTVDEEYINEEDIKYRMFESLKDDVEKNATLLYNNSISSKNLIPVQVATVIDYKSKTIDFYNAIEKYKNRTPIDIVENNGRKYHFQSYVEREIRTTIQNTATNYLVESAGNLGVIFHLCNYLQDCADDHADFQGKIYVVKGWEGIVSDEETRERVRQFIKKENIQYLEDAVDGTLQWYNPKTKKSQGVYLTTRPNCRHFLRPVSIEEALDYKNTLKKEKMENGKYDKTKYEALEKQRKLERDIRDLKMKIQDKKTELKKTTDTATVSQINTDISALNKKLFAKQKDMRDLIKNNSNLVRLPKRESVDPQGVFKH